MTADTPTRRRRVPRRPDRSPKVARAASDLLGLSALSADGVGVREDGALLRWLEVSALNPLIRDEEGVEQLSHALAQVVARLETGQSLQLIAQASPLALDDTIDREAELSQRATRAAQASGAEALAAATRGLAAAQEHSLRTHSLAVASMALRYFVVCPWTPELPRRGRGLRPAGAERSLRLAPAAFERALRESARHADGLRADLETAGIRAKELDGDAVAQLIWARFSPAQADTNQKGPAQSSPALLCELAELGDEATAQAHTHALKRALCPQSITLADQRSLTIGGQVENVRYLGSLPEQTWLGWLLYLMQAPRPFTLTVHVRATDRDRERLHHRRRYKRIYANNRSTEGRGRPLDPEAREQEQEADELRHELSLSGARVFAVSCYLAVRDPVGDAEVLGELTRSVCRDLAGANEAHMHEGRGAQRRLWQSTLPLGLDVAGRARKYVSRNVGDSFPLVGTQCGSPDGLILGYASIGRTLTRLDFYDPLHINHMLVINGAGGSGKTTIANLLAARAMAQGANGAIIERGGHYAFLASLIPGAENVPVGAHGHAVCPWDVPDPERVSPEKVDYLLGLHAMLIGAWRGQDANGLSALEQNLLGRAIRQVYERCALTAETPRELLLQEVLITSARRELENGAGQMADALHDLAARLHNFVGDGPYAYLTDRPTTVPAGAPLTVFDTSSIPETFSGAALFIIVEHIAERIATLREAHLARPRHSGDPLWAGRYFLIIDEAWKLVEKEATGRWVNELARRSRHLALALVAISQQLSDFDNHWGRALLDNAAMKLILGQQRRELEYVRDELGLSDEEIRAIEQLRTVKREYSTAYLVNGQRGRGTVTVRLSDYEYWTCTHDPHNDEPLRRQALRDSGGDPWGALERLADVSWHQAQQETS